MNPCACKSASLEVSVVPFDFWHRGSEPEHWIVLVTNDCVLQRSVLSPPPHYPLSHYPHYYAWTPATGQFAPRLQLLHIKWLGAALSASLQHYCSIVNCEHCSLQTGIHCLLSLVFPGVSCVCISASAEDKYGNQDNQDIISHSLLSCMHSSSEDESRNQVQGL